MQYVQDKSKFVVMALLGAMLILGIEVAANRVFNASPVLSRASGMKGSEGGGYGGGAGSGAKDQSMPKWMRDLYDWLYGKPSMAAFGGGGGAFWRIY